jgi:exonuclease VII large subunit
LSGIVTSPTGAVIRDMLQILPRFANLHVASYPSGPGMERRGDHQGIEILNRYPGIDVIIWRVAVARSRSVAFNEETMARHLPQGPVISHRRA